MSYSTPSALAVAALFSAAMPLAAQVVPPLAPNQRLIDPGDVAGSMSKLSTPQTDTFPLRFGVTLLAGFPASDLRTVDPHTGLGAGLFAESLPANGLVLQTRIDYLSFAQHDNPDVSSIPDLALPDSLTVSATLFDLGVEVRQDLPWRPVHRFFVLAGLLATRYEFQTSAASQVVDQNGLSQQAIVRGNQHTQITGGLALGAGLHLGPDWTVDVRYTTTRSNGANLTTWQTGLGVRF